MCKIEKCIKIEKSGRGRPGRGGGFGNSDTPGQGEGGWFENPRFWRTSFVDGPLHNMTETQKQPEQAKIYEKDCSIIESEPRV